MTTFSDLDPATLLAGTTDRLDAAAAAAVTAHPLDSVDTEYPHHAGAVEGPEGPPRPSDQHPVFFGCYDWHSAVHSHWCLVRSLRLFDHPDAGEIVATVDERLDDEGVAAEVAHLDANPSFERPYGWAWLLRLAAELALWDDPRADAWRDTLAPLETWVADHTADWLATADRPFRVGTHGNSAFAVAAALDYARVVGDESLAERCRATALEWYRGDTDAPLAYEPLGWDFVSPTLTEADLLRRVLDPPAFAGWLDDFLPTLASEPVATLPEPVGSDTSETDDDGLATHFVGLNLTRAWCLAGVADTLAAVEEAPGEAPSAGTGSSGTGGDADAPTTWPIERLRSVARDHAAAGVREAFTDDYAGAHWLSSFVCYLVSRHDGGIAPDTH
ncbi:DUF2891 family protein [Halobaculum sp. MBLA0147]|uniref:DUF2891 family protein n=1 Tax=Halobaculum sp. MBLA0147 TaxID=3079934 RepID=UPI0035250686